MLKSRHTGETGIAGYLRYDKETDRLESTTAPKSENPFESGDDNEEGDF